MAEAIWKLVWLLTEGGNLLSLHVSFYVLMVHMIIYLHGKESSSYSDPRSKNKSNKNTKRNNRYSKRSELKRRKLKYWDCILNTNLRTIRVRMKEIRLDKYRSNKWGYEWDHDEIMASLAHKVIHDPIVHYGQYFHEFFKQIDPLAVVKIARGDVIMNSSERTRKKRINLMPLQGADRYFERRSEQRPRRVYVNRDPGQVIPVVFDTGASVSISPVKEDFIGEIHTVTNETIKGLAHEINIAGYGRVRWVIRDMFGNDMTIETNALYIPEGDVRLFSPQSYFQEHRKGRMIVDHIGIEVLTFNSELNFMFPFNIFF